MTQAPAAADRARFLGLHRDAVRLLQRAARADIPANDVRHALLDAVQRLEALGAEPEARASETAETSALPPQLRAELRRAARDLASRVDSSPRVDIGPVLALLERVRVQLEGEIALYRNIDGRQFEDVSVASGLAAATFVRMGWGAAFIDADLDGRLDLFFANGHIFSDIDDYPPLGETYRQRNQLLLNVGARFNDVSAAAGGGLQVARVGRGLAVGDLDNDGDPDLVVSNMDEPPTILENRQRTGHHWLAVRVVSPTANRFAIGAKVTIDAGGAKQLREIRSGGSYMSQSDLRAYFGLGDYAGAVSVEIRMPGGDRWRWEALSSDRLHELELSASARVPNTGAMR